MADGKATHPTYPKHDRPLYTPDADAQRQVVERIAQAREGKRARMGKEPEPANVIHLKLRNRLPMGQHPYVGRDALADALGCKHTRAQELAKHPEELDPWQVRQLCELCGVTLEWLRGWEDVNAFGLYESTEDVAAMYAHLSNEDRALVCDLLTRLLGADAASEVKHEQWERDNHEWLDHNREKAQEIREHFRELQESVARRLTAAMKPARGVTNMVAMATKAASIAAAPLDAATVRATETVRQRMADIARAVLDIYTPEEWELIEQTAERLKGQGVDVENASVRELLAIGRGDSVED
jgi:hypothetical protein